MKKATKKKNKNPIKIKFNNNNSNKMKKHKIKFTMAKPPKEKVMVVAKEIQFARMLSGNDKKARDGVLKSLKRWLSSSFIKNVEFQEDNFLRLWKGLFYAVWMSDKPLIQEELCDNISSILELFPPQQQRAAMMMAGAGFKVLATEWYGLDQHRMDKFLMLARRHLRAALRVVARAGWAPRAARAFADMLGGGDGLFAPATPLHARNALSLLLHVADCFLEEVAKVSRGDIPEEALVQLLRPFAVYMQCGQEPRAAAASRRVLAQLARQSAPALEGEARRRAWRQMGCPEGGPDALQRETDDEDEDDEEPGSDDDGKDGPLDPRAGRVDVALPPLPTAAAAPRLAALLTQLARSARGAARLRLRGCAERFKKITEDKYPFPERDMIDARAADLRWDCGAAARDLAAFERELLRDPTREALQALNRRQRKKLLAQARLGAGMPPPPAPKVAAAQNGNWDIEEVVPTEETPTKKKQKRKPSLEPTEQDSSPPKKLKLVVKTEKSPKLEKKSKQKNKENQKSSDTQQNQIKSKKSDSPKEEKQLSPKVVLEKLKISDETPKKAIVSKESSKKKQDEPEQKDKLKVYGKPDKIKLVVKTKSLRSPKSGKSEDEQKLSLITPKKVQFVLKNNSMQQPTDYYKSIRASPNIPFDGAKKPSKTNLKPNSTPSPINPFFKKKLRLRN